MTQAVNGSRSGSGRRRGMMTETDDDSPRSGDSAGSVSAVDDETEESLIAKRVERLASSLQVNFIRF